MTPIVNGLAAEFSAELNVYQLDAARPEILTLQQRYGVRGHPSFALLDSSGEVAQRFLGPQDEEVLREAIKSLTVR